MLRSKAVKEHMRTVVDRDLAEIESGIAVRGGRGVHDDFPAIDDRLAGCADETSDRRDRIRPVIEKERSAASDLRCDGRRAFEAVPEIRRRNRLAGRHEETHFRVSPRCLLRVERVHREGRLIARIDVKSKCAAGSRRDVREFIDFAKCEETAIRNIERTGERSGVHDLQRSFRHVDGTRAGKAFANAAGLRGIDDQLAVFTDFDAGGSSDIPIVSVADLENTAGNVSGSVRKIRTGQDLRPGAVFVQIDFFPTRECAGKFRCLLFAVHDPRGVRLPEVDELRRSLTGGDRSGSDQRVHRHVRTVPDVHTGTRGNTKVCLITAPVLLAPAAIDERTFLNVDQRAVTERKFDRIAARTFVLAGLRGQTARSVVHERTGAGELDRFIVSINERVAGSVIIRFGRVHHECAVEVDRNVLRLANENVLSKSNGRAGIDRYVFTPCRSC